MGQDLFQPVQSSFPESLKVKNRFLINTSLNKEPGDGDAITAMRNTKTLRLTTKLKIATSAECGIYVHWDLGFSSP